MRLLVVHPRLGAQNNSESICTEKIISALHSVGAEVVVVSGDEVKPANGIQYHTVIGSRLNKSESLAEKLHRLFHLYPESGWGWAAQAAEKISWLAQAEQIDVVYSRGMPFIRSTRQPMRSRGIPPPRALLTS